MPAKTKRAKKAPIRKHEVKAELENFQLAKAKSALTLRIYSRGEKVGELQVGRGSLYWWGKHKQTPKRVNWDRFTEMMNRIAYGE
jgi:hypothetical protein